MKKRKSLKEMVSGLLREEGELFKETRAKLRVEREEQKR